MIESHWGISGNSFSEIPGSVMGCELERGDSGPDQVAVLELERSRQVWTRCWR